MHRLVALAYIPNPNNKPCVCHKDNNPLNNRGIQKLKVFSPKGVREKNCSEKETRLSTERKVLFELVDKFNYGTKEYRTVLKPIPEKLIKLSKAKEIESKRKKALYEEEWFNLGPIESCLSI